MTNSIWLPSTLGAMMGFATFGAVQNLTANKIPKTDQVQQGYVVPSKLEIELKDIDGNGEKEVLMNYGGTSYLLTLDEQGKPRVQAYQIKPAEVVPRE